MAGQVEEGRDRDQHGRDDRGQEEAAVDGVHAVAVAVARARAVDADQRGEHADRRDDEREDHALLAERDLAEDERRDERDGVRLEQVGGHAGAVADVVADVVGDGGGVARVVLGDALLDLADEVGADVGRLGEDATADAHEHREQRAAEGEALEHAGGVSAVDQQHDRRAEQAQADGEHADDAAGAERQPQRLLGAGLVRGVGDAQVGAGRERHADEADQRRERRTDQEEDRTADADRGLVGRQQEQQEEHQSGEDGERLELPVQVGGSAFLDGLADLDHLRGALAGGQDLLGEHSGEAERHQGRQQDEVDDRLVAVGEGGQVLAGDGEDGRERGQVGRPPVRCDRSRPRSTPRDRTAPSRVGRGPSGPPRPGIRGRADHPASRVAGAYRPVGGRGHSRPRRVRDSVRAPAPARCAATCGRPPWRRARHRPAGASAW